MRSNPSPASALPGRGSHVLAAVAYFSAPTNAISFRAEHLDNPMPNRDPARFAALAEDLHRLGGKTNQLDLLPRVLSEIQRSLPEGAPGIDRIAGRIGVPRRTVQRRLGEHGVTFSACLDRVRTRLSLIYLGEPYLSIASIAELLGYSEVSAFSRACRRRHGASPNAVRSRPATMKNEYRPGRKLWQA